MDEASPLCTLVSVTCTTGWFDWIHGELWVCPDGVLRRSLGLATTVGRGVFPRRLGLAIKVQDRPPRTFSSDEIASIIGLDRRNRWIAWSSVAFASLKRGPTTTSLHLQLGDGRREKLLWIRTYVGADDALEAALARSLPGRFDATYGPLG